MSAAADARMATIDDVVQAEMERWGIPGYVVGLLVDGEMAVHAFGTARIDSGERMLPESLVRIASISKVFTATLLMTLVDDGRIDLDAPLIELLPDLPLADRTARAALTMRHLLSHTAGFFGDDDADFGQGDDALGRAIANFGTLHQTTQPGELWSYNNAAYDLAGHIAATVLGQPFETAMNERVLQPLGLQRTFFWAHDAFAYPAAIGHVPVRFGEPERVVDRGFGMPRRANPCGGLISNASDVLTFARFHLGDGTANGKHVLAQSTLQAMREPQTTAANFADAWGLGWDLRWLNGALAIGHGGSACGYQTRLTLLPEHNAALFIGANDRMGLAANDQLERQMLAAIFDIAVPQPPAVSLPGAALTRWAGEYRFAGATLLVSVTGDRLLLELRPPAEAPEADLGIPATTVVPISEQEFLATDGVLAGLRTDFITNADGSPRFIRFAGRLGERAG